MAPPFFAKSTVILNWLLSRTIGDGSAAGAMVVEVGASAVAGAAAAGGGSYFVNPDNDKL